MTPGSIVCPSGANGDVGIKPTLGVWSRAGIVPISADQDTAGPIARNVTDAAVLLGAGVGVDAHDAATAAQAGHAFKDYTRFLDAGALKGARIGVWHSYDPDVADPAHVAIFKATVEQLKSLGATVVDPLEIDFGTGSIANSMPSCASSRPTSRRYLATYTARRLPEDAPGPHRLQQRPQEPRRASAGPTLEQPRVRPGRSDRRQVRSRLRGRPRRDDPVIQAAIDDAMAANDLDAIVAPTNNPAWVTDPVNGDSFDGYVSSSSAAAVSGYAGITVANGFVGPLPVGVSFIGGRWSEPTLSVWPTHMNKRPTCASRPGSSRRRSSIRRDRHGSRQNKDSGGRSGATDGQRLPPARTSRLPVIHR